MNGFGMGKSKNRKEAKVSLPTVTLLCVSGVNLTNSIYALWRSAKQIDFAAVKIISPERPSHLPLGIHHETPHDSQLDSIDAYSHYMIYDLWRHVETDHCLVVQADGYVIEPTLWSDDFLMYDYIGAPWRLSKEAYLDPWGNSVRVGNGGFSLRSKRLLEVPNRVNIPWDVNASDFYKHMNAGLYSEDGNICVHNRHLFEEAGCIWAPLDLAVRFSREQKISERQPRQTFGFHKRLPGIRQVAKDRLYRRQFMKASG